MKQLMDTPGIGAGAAWIADYAELRTLECDDREVSQQDIIAELKRTTDASDDVVEEVVEDAFSELDVRQEHMGDYGRKHYPYTCVGDLLTKRRLGKTNDGGWLYLFLLLGTRSNMMLDAVQRTEAGEKLNGTHLFERLSLAVAKSFWGGEDRRADGMLFGTSRCCPAGTKESAKAASGFRRAVGELCARWGEGAHYRPKDTGAVFAQDDRLDIVVWRKFSDARQGTLAGFGQCKTGTTWESMTWSMQPEAFCQKWMHNPPIVRPVRLFFLTERITSNWYGTGADAGIVFDRCRMLDYADRVPPALLRECVEWTRAVMRKNDLKW